jgi:hypothetical protein
VARDRVADLVSTARSFSIRIDGWKSDLAGVLANKRAVVSGIVGLSGIPGPGTWRHGATGGFACFRTDRAEATTRLSTSGSRVRVFDGCDERGVDNARPTQ